MQTNARVLAVTIVGLLCLVAIFLFDPTHDYPSMAVEVELFPGESVNISIPTTAVGALQWAATLVSEAYLWVEADVGGLELTNFSKLLTPFVLLGFPPDASIHSGYTTVRNVGNTTVLARINSTMAPTPEVVGKIRGWWYIAFGSVQTVIGAVLAIVRPATVAALKSPAATTASLSLAQRFVQIFDALRRRKAAAATTAAPTTGAPPVGAQSGEGVSSSARDIAKSKEVPLTSVRGEATLDSDGTKAAV